MLRRLVFATVMVLFSVSLAVAQPVTDEFLVIPGQSVGAVRHGMTITDITKLLGPPQISRMVGTPIFMPVPSGAMAFAWPPPPGGFWQTNVLGIVVLTDAMGVAYQIRTP
jgi:hypothetical protein